MSTPSDRNICFSDESADEATGELALGTKRKASTSQRTLSAAKRQRRSRVLVSESSDSVSSSASDYKP